MANASTINKSGAQNRTKKEIEAISEKIKASKLHFKDIIIPLSVAVILIILGIFVFVPMIKTAIDFRIEYREVKDKEESLEELEADVKSIDEGIFQVDLLNAKTVIPKTLQVSSFMYYIDTLANEKNLASKSLSAGDIEVSYTVVEENEKVKNSYLGVSGPLAYSGDLDGILEFLDTLYSASPYIISAENVSLQETGEQWRVTLNVTGYYVPETNTGVDFYETFTKYTNYQEVIDIFTEKAEQLL